MASVVLVTLEDINLPGSEEFSPFELSLTVGTSTASFYEVKQELTFLVNSAETDIKLSLIQDGEQIARTQLTFSNIFQHTKKIKERLVLTPTTKSTSNQPPNVELKMELQQQTLGQTYRRSQSLQRMIEGPTRKFSSPRRSMVAEFLISQDPYIEQLENLKLEIEGKVRKIHPLQQQNSKLKALLQKAIAAREELHGLMQESSESINQKVASLNSKIKNLIHQNSRLQGEAIQEQQKISMMNYENHSLKRNLADQGKELEDSKQKILLAAENEKALRATYAPSGIANSKKYEQCITQYKQQYEEFVEILNNLQDDKETLESTILNEKEQLVDTKAQMNILNKNLETEKVQRKRLEDELALALSKLKQIQEYQQAELHQLNETKGKLDGEINTKREQITKLKTQFEQLKLNSLKRRAEKDTQINQLRFIKNNLQINLKSTKSDLEKASLEFELSQIRAREEAAQLKNIYDLQLSKLTEDLHRSQQEIKSQAYQLQSNTSLLQSQYSELEDTHTKAIKELSEKKTVIQNLVRENEETKKIINSSNQEILVLNDLKSINETLKTEAQIFQQQNQSLRNDLADLQNLLQVQGKRNQDSNQRVQALNAELFDARMDLEKLKAIVAQWKTSAPRYIPVKNDPVDQALADYLNNREEAIEIPFVREDAGVYMFGFKKVFVKIQNGQVIIRVGGGYMLIDEFLELYTPMEIEKIKSKDTRLNEIAKTMIYGKYSSVQDANQAISQELSAGQFATMYTERKGLLSPSKLLSRESKTRRSTFGNFRRN